MLQFCAIGFAVVMIVLIILSLVTSFVGIFFSLKERPKKAPATPSAPVAPATNDIPDDHAFVISAAVAAVMPELQDEQSRLIAVIAAATAIAIEDEHRIVSFKQVPDAMSYARQGRMQIYASKNYVPERIK